MSNKQRGFAVISGSGTNAIVAKIMENGRVDFGSSAKTVEMHVTGTLVLDGKLSDGEEGGANKVLFVGTNGTASIAQLSASNIAVRSDFGGATATVSGALEYLSGTLLAVSSSIASTSTILSVSGTSGNEDLTLGASNEFVLVGSNSNITVDVTANSPHVTASIALSNTLTGLTSVSSTYLTASTGVETPRVQPSSGDLTLQATNVKVEGALSSSGNFTAGGNLTVNGTGNSTIAGNLTVQGDLLVSGSTVTLEVQNLRVEDPIIVLGSSSLGSSLEDGDRGFVFDLTGSSNQAFGWDYSDSRFKLGSTTSDGTTSTLNITADAILELGTLSGSNISGTNVVADNLTVNGTLNLPDNSVTNDDLVNDSITVTAGNGLLGGGLVALGGAITLSASYGSTANTAVEGNTQVTFSGVANEIQIVSGSPLTLGSGGTVTIGLPDNIEISGNLLITGSLTVTGSTILGNGSGTSTTTVIGNFRHPIFSIDNRDGSGSVANFPIVPNDYVASASQYAGYSFYLTSSLAAIDGVVPGSGSWAQGNKWYFNENGEWFASFFYSI